VITAIGARPAFGVSAWRQPCASGGDGLDSRSSPNAVFAAAHGSGSWRWASWNCIPGSYNATMQRNVCAPIR